MRFHEYTVPRRGLGIQQAFQKCLPLKLAKAGPFNPREGGRAVPGNSQRVVARLSARSIRAASHPRSRGARCPVRPPASAPLWDGPLDPLDDAQANPKALGAPRLPSVSCRPHVASRSSSFSQTGLCINNSWRRSRLRPSQTSGPGPENDVSSTYL